MAFKPDHDGLKKVFLDLLKHSYNNSRADRQPQFLQTTYFLFVIDFGPN
jgi:hypothetical protein